MSYTPLAATPAATPAQLLADCVVLTPSQVAFVLGLTFTRGRHAGQPDRRRVLALVDEGRLTPIDPRQSFPRWTFSTAAVRRYLDGPSRSWPNLPTIVKESA